MGRFVIIFKKKYPKFKLGDHINLIFKEGVDGGDTIKINGKTVPLLVKYRNGAILPVDHDQFTVGNKYVGEWTTKGLQIYAGELVKKVVFDDSKKTLSIIRRDSASNWYPCLFTQFKIESVSDKSKNRSALYDNSTYTLRLSKSIIEDRSLNGSTFAMLKYQNRVIPFLDKNKNYITLETLLAISNKNTSGYDVNYITISGTYRSYFKFANNILDGIEIDVPANTQSHVRYNDYPAFNNGLADNNKFYVVKSVFVKNRLYAIPSKFANTPEMQKNFLLSNDKITFIDRFGKNWTDSCNTDSTNISKFVFFGDNHDKIDVSKNFELCIPTVHNDGLFKNVTGSYALFCLPGMYDFTTSIGMNPRTVTVEQLRYINELPYGIMYRKNADAIDLKYIREIKSSNPSVNKYTEWILPHFMAIYKILDNALNSAPYKFKTPISYNNKNVYQYTADLSGYNTINILARNKTPQECASIVNGLAANIKKFKFPSIIRLIYGNKVPYETIKDSLNDAKDYAIYDRVNISKEEFELIETLPASIATETPTILDKLRTYNTDILFPNVKNLNDFGLVQDCLGIRPNHYFLDDRKSSHFVDENSLYTVKFNGPKLEGIVYYLANDIAEPMTEWQEITNSTKLSGLRGKTVIAVFKPRLVRHYKYDATISVKDKSYKVQVNSNTITPAGVVMYRIIPQSGVTINTNIITMQDTDDGKWSLIFNFKKLPPSPIDGVHNKMYVLYGNSVSGYVIDLQEGNGNTNKAIVTDSASVKLPPKCFYKICIASDINSVTGKIYMNTSNSDDYTEDIKTKSVNNIYLWQSETYELNKQSTVIDVDIYRMDKQLGYEDMTVVKKDIHTDLDNLFDIYDINEHGLNIRPSNTVGINTDFEEDHKYNIILTDMPFVQKDGHSIVAIRFNNKIIPLVDSNRQYIRTSDLISCINTSSSTNTNGTIKKLVMTYKAFYRDANICIDGFEVTGCQSSYKRSGFTENTIFLVGADKYQYQPRYKYFKGNVIYSHKRLSGNEARDNHNIFYHSNMYNSNCSIDLVNKTADIYCKYYSDFTNTLNSDTKSAVLTVGRSDAGRISLNVPYQSPYLDCMIAQTHYNCNAVHYDLFGLNTLFLWDSLKNTSCGRLYMFNRNRVVDGRSWCFILCIDDYVNSATGRSSGALTTEKVKLHMPAFKCVVRRKDFDEGKYKEGLSEVFKRLKSINIDNKTRQLYIADEDYVFNVLGITPEELFNMSKQTWNNSDGVNLFVTNSADLDDTSMGFAAIGVSFNSISGAMVHRRDNDLDTDIIEVVGGSRINETATKESINSAFLDNDTYTIIAGREKMTTRGPNDGTYYNMEDYIRTKNITIKQTITTLQGDNKLFDVSGNPVGYYKISRGSVILSSIDNLKFNMSYILLDGKYKIPVLDNDIDKNYVSVKLLIDILKTSSDVYLEVKQYVATNDIIKYPIYGAILMNFIDDKRKLAYNSIFYDSGDHVTSDKRHTDTQNMLSVMNTVPETNIAITSNNLLPDIEYDDQSGKIPLSGLGMFIRRSGMYVFNANITDALLAEDTAFQCDAKYCNLGLDQYGGTNRIRLSRNYGVNQINTYEPFLDNLSMRYVDDKEYKNTQNVNIGTFLRTSSLTPQRKDLFPQSNILIDQNDVLLGTGRNTYIAIPELFAVNTQYAKETGTTEWKQKYGTKVISTGVVYDYFVHSSDIMYATFIRNNRSLNGLHNDLAHKNREGQLNYPNYGQVLLIPHFKGVLHFYKQLEKINDTSYQPTSISIGDSPVNIFTNRYRDINHKNYVIYLDNIENLNDNVNWITSFITKYYKSLHDSESVSIIVNNYAETSNNSNQSYNASDGSAVNVKRASLNRLNSFISRINKVLKQEVTTDNTTANLKIAVYFTNSRYQVMGPWSNEYLNSRANIITAKNPTGDESDRIKEIIDASKGNTKTRNIFKGFNLTLNIIRNLSDCLQAKNPKAYVGFVDPVIFETV